jgi:hypothetical protein
MTKLTELKNERNQMIAFKAWSEFTHKRILVEKDTEIQEIQTEIDKRLCNKILTILSLMWFIPFLTIMILGKYHV